MEIPKLPDLVFKKKFIAPAMTLALLTASCSFSKKPVSEVEKQSYALGVQMAQGTKRTQVELSPEMIARGLKDALSNSKMALSEEEIQSALLAMSRKAETIRQTNLQGNLADAQAFMEKYMKSAEVKRTPSGVFYRILKNGDGAVPTDKDRVRVHYTGKLSDGKVFDSSVLRGTPAELQINSIIPGWREALKLMKAGSKWEIAIPPELGYGETGNLLIPPNSALLFEVELLAVLK